jgi:hypothetical protein
VVEEIMNEITICPAINKTEDRAKVNKKRKKKPTKRNVLSNEWSCDLCRLKATCKALCPPMEWLIQQVEVEPAKELPLDNVERQPDKWPESPTTSENIFCMFFFDQKKQTEIANTLYITQQYVSKVVNKYKRILLKNLRK